MSFLKKYALLGLLPSFCCCDQHSATDTDEYELSLAFFKKEKIKRISVYEVPKTIYWKEDSMRAKGFPVKEFFGDEAEEIWSEITLKDDVSLTFSPTAKIVSRKYIVVAESEKNLKTIVKVEYFHKIGNKIIATANAYDDEWVFNCVQFGSLIE